MSLGGMDILYAPEYVDRTRGYRAARLAGEAAPTAYEFEGLRKDGRRIWLDARAQIVSWDGEPAIQFLIIDITERKEAELTLRGQQRVLEATLENVEQGIAMYDADLNILA